ADARRRLLPLETDDAVFAECDAVAPQTRGALGVDFGRPVGAEHEIATPAGELQRKPEPARAAPVDRERPIAHLPRVAVRAMKYAPSVQLMKAGNLRQIVA